VELLYEDYKVKLHAAKKAENLWRTERNTVGFVLTPKSENEQGN